MSIFNSFAPSGGGVKLSTFTPTQSYIGNQAVTSISFNVDARPTSWYLFMSGSHSGYMTNDNSAYYYVMGAYSEDGTSAVCAYCNLPNNRLYEANDVVSGTYSNGVLTVARVNTVFFPVTKNDASYFTWYLFYTV